VKVKIDRAMVAAFDVRLDVGGFHPRKEALRYQNEVDACPIVSFACRDLRVPTCPMT